MEPIKTGLILEPILPEDYQFGGETKLSGAIIEPSADWTPYLPTKEKQHNTPFDTQSCTSFATTSAIETLHKKLFGIEPNYSDRFLSKIAETTPQGNTPKKVAEAWRKNGIVPESEWPFSEAIKSFADYFADIPARLFQMANIWLTQYTLGYEYVNASPANIKEALKRGTVCASFYAWVKDDNGVYYKPQNAVDTHWAQIAGFYPNGNYKVYDSYEPFIKEVRKDTYPAIAIRYSLTKRAQTPTLWEKFLQLLTLITTPAKPEVPPTVPPTNSPAPARKRLYDLAKAHLGRDISKTQDERGCAESLSYLLGKLHPDFPSILSTVELNRRLSADKRFKGTLDAKPGTIIMSPTQGAMIGHCGIFGENMEIMSNSSATSKWSENFTLATWIAKYRTTKHLKIYYYEPL